VPLALDPLVAGDMHIGGTFAPALGFGLEVGDAPALFCRQVT
jgi:hypothetical protein